MENVIFEATKKQQEFLDAVFSGKYKYLLYGGAIRGGKTFVEMALAVLLCKIYPGSRWAIVRKDLPRIKRNVIPVWNKIAPKSFFSGINKTDWEVTAKNGSRILFFPENWEQDKELDRWRGLEVNGVFFDEINECQENTFLKAIERIGSWTIPNAKNKPLPIIIGTCNPSDGWVKRVFYDPWKEGILQEPYFYLPAKITDNPHLDPQYLENLKNLPSREYDKFVNGNWDLADIPDQLIKSFWILDSFNKNPVYGEKQLGIDVARFGDDQSVITLINGNHVENIYSYKNLSTSELASKVKIYAEINKIRPLNIKIDTIGVGGGVADFLRYHEKMLVREFVGGARPQNKHKFFHFKNKRAEAFWHLREGFDPDNSDNNIEFSNNWSLSINSEIRKNKNLLQKLIDDLTSIRYSIDNEKCITIESKDKIKQRLGRSPDYADALAIAFYKDVTSNSYLNRINVK